ncbi:urease accessory protein UreE [Deinococcus cellulosilyticus]|uniref:Urease accessory protein UreE n=1 Tax=Deinococcus cellulosilyticus (strain DSM 18568 / NBRC 106333 / KACC 11606 / 5516J-15) TaxID=1223518 RepID=A0A511MWP8_DEIC1|nr:urease accessory protein UreE [Deinococcus cellulosilyticus]GEM45002.1 urease accessory protein UreE [Deinococcus cellulosilyticus NBRC 106333 = KACC 11606]
MFNLKTTPQIRELPPQDTTGLQMTEIPMTCWDRQKVRRRLKAPDGVELLLALPTGTVLQPGTVLDIQKGRAYQVVAALEEVLVYQPENLTEAMKFAHFIGNQHRDIDFTPEGILVLSDVGLEARLKKLGFQVFADHRPYSARPISEYAHG